MPTRGRKRRSQPTRRRSPVYHVRKVQKGRNTFVRATGSTPRHAIRYRKSGRKFIRVPRRIKMARKRR
jgi:hypothetical protein